MLEETLSPALEAFAAALGPGAVLTSDEDITEFRDPFWPAGDDTHSASAIVMPTTTEEVQAVVRIANEHGIPLWAHSTGRNNGYGGPAPRVGGSVIVSLRTMNRVLEIDDDLAYAVVEPGARWFDIHDALQDGGHDLMVSIPDLGWGSAVGNSLDNGVTYLNPGRDFRMVCGMEVVLADGSLLRTGMGAMEGNPAWHTYKRGLGPVLDPLFMQSNLGIVTRMGIWLQRRPECYLPAAFKLWRDEDIDKGLEIVRDLMMDGVMDGVPNIFNTLISASVLATRSDWSTDPAPLDDGLIDRIATRPRRRPVGGALRALRRRGHGRPQAREDPQGVLGDPGRGGGRRAQVPARRVRPDHAVAATRSSSASPTSRSTTSPAGTTRPRVATSASRPSSR